jgi:hypothetical protein
MLASEKSWKCLRKKRLWRYEEWVCKQQLGDEHPTSNPQNEVTHDQQIGKG